MIDTIKDLGFHPTRIHEQHRELRAAVSEYLKDLDRYSRAIKNTTESLQDALRRLHLVDQYLEQESIVPGNLPPPELQGDCRPRCLNCVRNGVDEWEACYCAEPQWCMDWHRIEEVKNESRAALCVDE